MSNPKPMPAPDHLTSAFWAACKKHELRIQRCLECGSVRFPPGPVCLQCRSSNADWLLCKGVGKVYSWIVVRHPIPADIYASEVPYVVALIDLDEGVRMPSNIIGCDPNSVVAEMRVKVEFQDASDTVTLPRFRPLS